MARTKRKTPLVDHPMWQEALLIRELLREDAAADKSGSGRIVIAGNADEYKPRLRYEAQQLERMARLDVNYPEDE